MLNQLEYAEFGKCCSQFTLFVSSAVTDNFKIDLKPLSVHENRNDCFSRYCCEDGMLHSYLSVLLTFVLCLKIESRPDMSSFIRVIVCSVVMWVYWNHILTFFIESSWASIFVFWIAVPICQKQKCILDHNVRMYSMQDKKPTGPGLFCFWPCSCRGRKAFVFIVAKFSAIWLQVKLK